MNVNTGFRRLGRPDGVPTAQSKGDPDSTQNSTFSFPPPGKTNLSSQSNHILPRVPSVQLEMHSLAVSRRTTRAECVLPRYSALNLQQFARRADKTIGRNFRGERYMLMAKFYRKLNPISGSFLFPKKVPSELTESAVILSTSRAAAPSPRWLQKTVTETFFSSVIKRYSCPNCVS